MTKLYRTVVPISEYSLCALLLAQPVTGLGATLFSGRPFTLFWWQIPQLIPEDQALRATFHLAHEVGAWVLGALIAGHAASALIHQIAESHIDQRDIGAVGRVYIMPRLQVFDYLDCFILRPDAA